MIMPLLLAGNAGFIIPMEIVLTALFDGCLQEN